MQISVIICSHNPRRAYLERTLAALRKQTLPLAEWELLLIDNASSTSLPAEWDLTWHPQARHIREEELGLTPARLRGIRESRADLLLLVDDDNVLAEDYLGEACRIGKTCPWLGAWGGSLAGEFEGEVPEWTRPYWVNLAVRPVEQVAWSNLHEWSTTPVGAGMVVRREVAERYAAGITGDAMRRALDRRGNSLASAGDLDLSYTAIDAGYGCGLFPSLKLTHLIPAQRLEESYLVRMVEESLYSDLMLRELRGLERSALSPPSGPLRSRIGSWKRRLCWESRRRAFFEAMMRGRTRAALAIADLRGLPSGTKVV